MGTSRLHGLKPILRALVLNLALEAGVMENRLFVALRMTKRVDSCPFGFAQGRPFAGMTDQFSACATSFTPYDYDC